MMLVFVEVDSDTDGNFRFVAPKIFLEGEMPLDVSKTNKIRKKIAGNCCYAMNISLLLSKGFSEND